MKTAMIVLGLFITTVVLMGAFTGCGFRHKSPEARADHMVDKVTKKLNLNDAQVVKLKMVKDEFLKARQDMKANRQEMKTSVLEMLEQPKLDQQRVLSLVKEKTRNVNDKAPQVVAALADFYDSLSPEQQQTLRENVKDKMEHRRHAWKRY